MANIRFKLQKSEKENHYIVTDTENNYVVEFEKGKFNDTQKITPLYNSDTFDAITVARRMRDLGDWLIENHSEIL